MNFIKSLSRRFILRILSKSLALVLPILGGCNHLFYYPSKTVLAPPNHDEFIFEEFTLETRDGVELSAWIFKPRKNKSIGRIIQFHGNAENMSTHVYSVLWLIQHGFDVMTFDYRGYGKSAGSPERSGLVIDGQATLGWACSQSPIPTVVVAQSIGGAVFIPAFAKSNAPCIKLAVLESTFASYRTIARDKISGLWLTWPLQWPLSFLISDKLSPIDYINQLSIPLLFIHATEDEVVPYSQSESLFQSYKGPKNFWTVPGSAHAGIIGDNRLTYQEKLVNYLKMEFLPSKLSEDSPINSKVHPEAKP